MRSLVSLFCFFCILCATKAQLLDFDDPPAVQAYVHQRGIAKLQTLLTPFITIAMTTLVIPDQDQSVGLGIHMYMRNIKVKEATIGSDALQYAPPDSLTLSVKGVNMKCTMDWEYKDALFIDSKGTADLTVSDAGVVTTISLAGSPDGKPSVTVGDVTMSIGDIDINLHGSGQSFFNTIIKIVKGMFMKKLPDMMQDKVRQQLKAAITKADAAFTTIHALSSFTTLHYGFVSNSNLHGMIGKRYSQNAFNGDVSDLYYSGAIGGRISVDDGMSIDIQGYLQVPQSGSYKFQVIHNQVGQLEVSDQHVGTLVSGGKICGGEVTDETAFMNLVSTAMVPIRYRYQSGCKGGYFELKICAQDGTCTGLDALTVFTKPSDAVAFSVYPNYIEVALDAWFSLASGESFTYPHHALPYGLDSDRMISVALDEYIVNSFLWAMTKEGNITVDVFDSKLPANVPIRLTTESFRLVFGSLYEHYPHGQIAFHFKPLNAIPPTVSISAAAGLKINGQFAFSFNVIPDPLTMQEVNAIVFEADIDGVASVHINDKNNVNVNITALDMHLGVVSVNEDLFKKADVESKVVTFIQPFLNSVLASSGIPFINSKLQDGFPIPQLGPIQLQNTVLEVLDNVAFLHSDFDIHI